jgi:endonuclease/exonuclease/phosphatase family metal-dependent hydrolase
VKILSCNVGYLLDYDGSLAGYATAPHRALVGDERAEGRALARLVDVLVDEAPDLVCLLETDRGSIRTATDGQTDRIAARCAERGLDYHARAAPKYGADGLLPNAPLLGSLANGVLTRRPWPTTAHYLDAGPKRLVVETRLPGGLSVFGVHLGVSRSTRRRQLDEIATLVAGRDRAVVCGDFNAYDGFSELDALTDRAGLALHDPGETVPARPLDSLVTDTRTLDLFLTAPDVSVRRCEALPVQISDHRPIVLELADEAVAAGARAGTDTDQGPDPDPDRDAEPEYT